MSLSDDELAALFLSPSRLRCSVTTISWRPCAWAAMMPSQSCTKGTVILVFKTAREILHDDGEAEEMVEKVFMVIFRTANQFDPDRGTFKLGCSSVLLRHGGAEPRGDSSEPLRKASIASPTAPEPVARKRQTLCTNYRISAMYIVTAVTRPTMSASPG